MLTIIFIHLLLSPLLLAGAWVVTLDGGVTRGRVVIRPNSSALFGTVCSDGFKNKVDSQSTMNALAACHSAGIRSDAAVYTSAFGPGSSSEPIWMSNVSCRPDNYYLENCSFVVGGTTCQHGDDVGLKCSVPTSSWIFSLTGGASPSSGLVLLRPAPNLPLGTVYGAYFDDEHVGMSLRRAMCASVGHPIERPSTGKFASPLGMPRYFNPARCPLGATRIEDCFMEGDSVYLEDASWAESENLGIHCNYISTDQLSLQLVDGPQNWAGNLLVKFTSTSDQPGKTCFRALSSRWDTRDDSSMHFDTLNAVCAQLGFPTTTARMRFYGQRSGPVALDWVSCAGTQRLSQCNISSFDGIPSGCDSSTTAGVDCYPERTLQNAEVRLVGGFASFAGQIQYRYQSGGAWLTLSAGAASFGSDGTIRPAVVDAVCRHVMGSSYVANASVRFYGLSSLAPIWGDEARCPAGGTFAQCDIISDPNPSHAASDYAGVDCDPTRSSSMRREYQIVNREAQMRLVDGGLTTEWGGVCVSAINAFAVWDAFCVSSLGIARLGSSRRLSGNSTLPFFLLSNISCPQGVLADGLTSCASAPVGSHRCSAGDALFIDCDSSPVVPSEWIVDLIHGSASRGLVTFRPTRSHPRGVFCSTTDISALLAICRSLGFDNSTAPRVVSSDADEATGLSGYYMYSASCSPYHNVSHCSYAHFEAEACFPMVIDCFPAVDEPPMWQMRLSEGSHGRLDVKPFPSAQWGSVCVFGWTQQATEAACRSLGYGDFVSRQRSIEFYQYGEGPIWLSSVHCKPGDAFLQNCSSYFNAEGSSQAVSCGQGSTVALECRTAPLDPLRWEFGFRQYDLLWPSRLRVEMRPSALLPWGSVSQCLVPDSVVAAACQMAGFAHGVYAALPSVAGFGPIYASEFNCSAGTTDLRDCASNAANFGNLLSHGCDLTVDCSPIALDPSRWQFMLRDGSGTSGRLHVRPASTAAWGTVCNTSFSHASGVAACVSAGFSTPHPHTAQVYANAAVQTYGRIWLGGMECPGRPLTHLQNCSEFIFPADSCGHASDVWIECYPTISARLIDGPSNSRGRLEVKNLPGGQWGTVCNDYFASHFQAWQAACRSAGFLNVTFALYEDWGAGEGPINLDDVQCDGSEGETLDNCTFRTFGTSDCRHEEDAGVDCFPPLPPQDWAFRLQSGAGAAGRLEVRSAAGLPWGGICSLPTFNHTYLTWIAACSSVGIQTTRAVPRRFGAPESGYMVLEGVHCGTARPSLSECDHSGIVISNCSQEYAAGVDCDPPQGAEDPTRWTVRLSGGTKGRVELMFNTYGPSSEPWGTVCAASGSTPASTLRAVCAAAGHSTVAPPAVMSPTTDGYVAALAWQPIYLSNLACPDHALSLTDCSFDPIYSHSCSHADDLFVDCFPPTTSPPPSATAPSDATAPASGTGGTADTRVTVTAPPPTLPTPITPSTHAVSTTSPAPSTAWPSQFSSTATTGPQQPTSVATSTSETTTSTATATRGPTSSTSTSVVTTTALPTTAPPTEAPLPSCLPISARTEAIYPLTDSVLRNNGLRIIITSHPSDALGGSVRQEWKNMTELSAHRQGVVASSSDVSALFSFNDVYTGTREPEAFWYNFKNSAADSTGERARITCLRENSTMIVCTFPPTPTYQLSAAEGLEGYFVLGVGSMVLPACRSASSPRILDVHVEAEVRDPFGAAVDAIGTISNGVGAVVGALIGASVMEIQYVSIQMQSLCMSELDRRSSDAMQYFISPFIYFGFAAVAFGNIGISFVAGLLQWGLSLKFMRSRNIIAQDAWAAVRFPSLAYGISQVFYMGVCYGTFKLLSDEDDGLGIFGGVVSLFLLMGYISLLLYFVRATAHARFIQYTQFLSKPSTTRWLYPLGFWDPDNVRLSYGHMINPFRDECIRYNLQQFIVGFLVSLLIIISQIDCFVRFILVAAVFAGSACAHLYARPARLPPSNFLCAVAQLVMCVWCILSAVAIKNPSKEIERAKLMLALCQVVIVFCRAVYQFVIAVLEESRWRHFRRPDMHGFRDDKTLQAEGNKKAFMEGVNMEDLLLMGSRARRPPEKKRVASPKEAGVAAAAPVSHAHEPPSVSSVSQAAPPEMLPDMAEPLLSGGFEGDESDPFSVELVQTVSVEVPPALTAPPALTETEAIMRIGMMGMLDAFPEAARERHIEILIRLWDIDVDDAVKDADARENIALSYIAQQVGQRHRKDSAAANQGDLDLALGGDTPARSHTGDMDLPIERLGDLPPLDLEIGAEGADPAAAFYDQL